MNEILGGSFWPYINKSGINLEKYQIFSSFDKNNYVDNCFVYACKQSNLFDSNEIESLINVIKVRRVPSKTVKKVSEIFKKSIKITKLYDDGTSKISVDTRKDFPEKPCLNLLLFKDHYMLNEPVFASPFYINHKEQIDSKYPNMEYEKRVNIRKLHPDGRVKDYNKTPTSLRLILETIFEFWVDSACDESLTKKVLILSS